MLHTVIKPVLEGFVLHTSLLFMNRLSQTESPTFNSLVRSVLLMSLLLLLASKRL